MSLGKGSFLPQTWNLRCSPGCFIYLQVILILSPEWLPSNPHLPRTHVSYLIIIKTIKCLLVSDLDLKWSVAYARQGWRTSRVELNFYLVQAQEMFVTSPRTQAYFGICISFELTYIENIPAIWKCASSESRELGHGQARLLSPC